MTQLATIPAGGFNGPPPATLARGIDPVIEAVESLKAIRTFVANELRPHVDFGVIPGAGDKPTLLKPGAEKIALYYQTRIAYTIDRADLGNGHLEVNVRCDLLSRGNGATAAEGHGSCATMESKYRWRKAERSCPDCGNATVIKGRQEYGGGWLCFAKKGGCGAKFDDGDPAIEGQQTGRVENPDVWDVRNTVLKMALKRALVSAVLSLGSLSELFTQDIEDVYDLTGEAPTRPVATSAPQPAPKPGPAPARKPKDERTAFKLVRDGFDRLTGAFTAEFPEAPIGTLTVNTFEIERHIVKALSGKSTEGMKGDAVRKALHDLYQTNRNGVRKELKTYLDAKLSDARRDYLGTTADLVGDLGTDDGDPDVNYPGDVDPNEAGSAG